MKSFGIALVLLFAGYFVYGAIAEKVFGTDASRKMPSETKADGVDFVPMSPWKVFLIQFLNIAGLGPIFGAIMGVMFGPAAFLWIVFGTIFGGAVHDFISGMMSVRSGGDSLPELVGRELGPAVKQGMRVLSTVLLVLVVTVFVVTPAGLLDGMTPAWADSTFWISIILLYYLLATVLPVDKLIGRFYPIFGFALLFMAGGLLCVLLFGGHNIPAGFENGLQSRYADETHTVWPMMFVSIACGAVSGFHATQSPMMARCLTNERLARPIFYGAMVAEGVVALIWAAAAIAFTGGYDELRAYMAEPGHSAGSLVHDISIGWLGVAGGILAILGVVAAPITTGDTALRSARLIVADMLGLSQKNIQRRLLITLPLFAAAVGLMFLDFNVLWRYFAWTNQTLAAITLWACSVYLARHGKIYVICLVPAVFMTAVVISYILVAPTPEGFGFSPAISYCTAGAVCAILMLLFARYIRGIRSGKIIHQVAY